MSFGRDQETGHEVIDPITEQILLQVDSEILNRIDRISDELEVDRDTVVALALATLIRQVDLRDEGKMIVVCPISETDIYRDPLELVMREGPAAFARVYSQVMAPVEK